MRLLYRETIQMDLFLVISDLGNDRKNFEGVFSTQEKA
jgi:hypothetical protein